MLLFFINIVYQKKNISMKNDITYEYRKTVKRPDLTVGNIELGECAYVVLKNELKTPTLNSRLYHTTDTNQFFYDFKGKRYELNWLGSPIDDSELKKELALIKKEIEELKKNPAGLTDADRELLTQVRTLLDKLNIDELNSAVEKINGFDTTVDNAKTEIQNLIDGVDSIIADKVDKAITDSNIPDKVDSAIKDADIKSLADTAVQNAIENADIEEKVNEVINDSNIPDKVDTAIENADIDKKVQDVIDEKLSGLDPSANLNNISIYSNVESAYRTTAYSLEPSDIKVNVSSDGITYEGDHLEGFDDNSTINGVILDLVFTGKELISIGAMIAINIPSAYNVKIMYYDSVVNKMWKSYSLSKTSEFNGRATYVRESDDGKTTLTGPVNLKVVVYKK